MNLCHRHGTSHTSGARRPAQLDGTAIAANLHLSNDDLRRIEETVADAVPVWGPTPKACEPADDHVGSAT
jgi:aryl-alcohol dehydrogenase-like predicted oxidoreductase